MPLPEMNCRFASGLLAWAIAALLCGTVAAADPNSQNSGNSTEKESGETPAAKTSPKKTPVAEKLDCKKTGRKRRIVTVAGGEVALDTRHWPLLGKPDARYVFVEMFDYTCPHCQATHQAVRGTTAGEHTEACEIAKIAVAVWRGNRKQFAPFHSWLFESAYRRTAAEARQHAAELVGESSIRDELNRPHAGKYIAKHVELYEQVGSGSLPKLLFPTATLVGSVELASTLFDIIQRERSQVPVAGSDPK